MILYKDYSSVNNDMERQSQFLLLENNAKRLLTQAYGIFGDVIYFDIRTLLHNKYGIRFTEPISLVQCLTIIGKNEYETIVTNAIGNTN